MCTIGACKEDIHTSHGPIIAAAGANNQTTYESLKAGDVCYSHFPFLISKKYDDSPYQRSTGRSAILLDIHQATESSTWYLIVCPDGTFGWVKNLEGASTAFTIQQPVIPLYRQSPDDNDFLTDTRNFQFADTPAVIMGASLNPLSGATWIKIKADSLIGWTPLADMNIRWNEFLDSPRNCRLCMMERLGLSGIIRRPFLEQANQLLEKERPSLPQPVYFADLNFHKFSRMTWKSPLPVGKPDCIIRDTDQNKDAISTVIAYTDTLSAEVKVAEKRNRFTFLSQDGVSKHLIFDSDSSVVADYKKSDLDNDGFAEWLIKLNFTYPDGYYSTLLIADGKSMKSDFVLHTLDLGGSCGEPGCNDNVDSYWWIDKDEVDRSRIFRIFSYKDTIAVQTFLFNYSRNAGLREIKYRKLYAVLLGESGDRLAAQKLNLSLSARLSYNNLQVFPRKVNSHIMWSIGRIFEKQSIALSWMQSLQPLHKNIQMLALP